MDKLQKRILIGLIGLVFGVGMSTPASAKNLSIALTALVQESIIEVSWWPGYGSLQLCTPRRGHSRRQGGYCLWQDEIQISPNLSANALIRFEWVSGITNT